MSEVNVKYLKDENGNKFSPVTGSKSVFLADGSNLQTTIEDIYAQLEGGGGGVPLSDIPSKSYSYGNQKITVTWGDPSDVEISGVTLATWSGTKLIMKEGSIPTSMTDGTLIVDNKVRNQYQTNGYTVTGLTNGTTYYFGLFSYTTTNTKNTNSTNTFSAVPQEIPTSDVSNLKCKVGNTKLTLTWEDPSESYWKGTKVLYKTGSYPTSITDGTVVVDNTTKNSYSTTGLEITGLTNETTYYIKLFPYAEDGSVNTNSANNVTGTPQSYRTMTVKIDYTNSNPATWATYYDDAVGMEVGSSDWDDFFGHYPVLFKDGTEVCKLNPNDFTKDINGNSITSNTTTGDTMIAFPRRGVKIETSADKNTLTISMTDNPEDSNFTYYAHNRGSVKKDVFYMGSYLAYNSSNKLYSIPGNIPTGNVTIRKF